ncbi:MAG: hypothetical protein RBS56_04235 [Candidatus Gracilibacteria bacterium]|jgi:hypothetical protein|nr:hypothetical protein [Candidatus Gracilibacteria bacterium]
MHEYDTFETHQEKPLYISEFCDQPHDFCPKATEFLELPADVCSEISLNIEEFKLKINGILKRKSKTFSKALSEKHRYFLQKLAESTINFQAISRDKLLSDAPESLEIKESDWQNFLQIMIRTQIKVEKVYFENSKSSYFFLTNYVTELDGVEKFTDPILEVSEEDFYHLGIVLENAITSLKSRSYILINLLILLRESAFRERAVNLNYLKKIIQKKYQKILHEKDINQVLDYLAVDKEEVLNELGFKIIRDQDRLQAVLTKDTSDIEDDDLFKTSEHRKELYSILPSAIKEISSHFDRYKEYPVEEILMFMVHNRPFTIKNIVRAFRQYNLTPFQVRNMISHIRYLNSINESYSPIILDIYGSHYYNIGMSKKTHMEALGTYDSYEEDKEASLYPRVGDFFFNYAYFQKIIKEHFPHLYYTSSLSAQIIKTLSAFSAVGFKISFSILFKQIHKKNPEIDRRQLSNELSNIQKFLSTKFQKQGIRLILDNGYYLETSNMPSSISYKFFDWGDYFFTPLSKSPIELIEENEDLFLEKKIIKNDLSPYLRAEVLKLRDRTFGGPIPVVDSRQVDIIDFEENIKPKLMTIIWSVIEFENRRTKTENQLSHKIKIAILYSILSSQIKGKCIFYHQIVEQLSGFYDETSIRNAFTTLKKINAKADFRLKIGIQKIKTRVYNQDSVYFLDLKQ